MLERGRVAQSWRSERWDSLTFQFPRVINSASRLQLRDRRAGRLCLEGRDRPLHRALCDTDWGPRRCEHRVVALRPSPTSRHLLVCTERGEFEASNVIVATGPFQKPNIPAFGSSMPARDSKFTLATIVIPANCRPDRYWWWGAVHQAARSPKSCIRPAARFIFRSDNFQDATPLSRAGHLLVV